MRYALCWLAGAFTVFCLLMALRYEHESEDFKGWLTGFVISCGLSVIAALLRALREGGVLE